MSTDFRDKGRLPIGTIPSKFIALEDRLMLDAAAALVVAESMDGTDQQSQVQEATEQHYVQDVMGMAPHQQQNSDSSKSIAFIDASVANSEVLLEGLPETTEVIELDGKKDGVQQIAEALANSEEQYSSIHLLSHGQQGQLSLGSSTLDSENIGSQYAEQMATIKAALTSDADIFIYGCNFGEGEVGEQAVEQLAKATGADVAASDDLTGHVSLGGDWDLEYNYGDINSVNALAGNDNWLNTLGGEISTVVEYNASASSAMSQVNGQDVIVLTDQADIADSNIIVKITNNLGAEISGSTVTTNNSSGTAESINFEVTFADGGAAYLDAIHFTDLDNFDQSNYVDAIALDVTGTWSNMGNANGTDALVAYTNDAAGEAQAGSDTGETVTFSTLRDQGAISDVLLNPDQTVENNYYATFTFDTAQSNFTLFGSDAVLSLNQVTSMTFEGLTLTYNSFDVADDSTTVQPGNAVVIDPLANDDNGGVGLTITKIDGQDISVGNPVTLANGIEVSLLANGTLSVESPIDMADTETFEYTVENGGSNYQTATV